MSEETKRIIEEINELKQAVKDIQMTLENETNRNLRIIAEDYLDFSVAFSPKTCYHQ